MNITKQNPISRSFSWPQAAEMAVLFQCASQKRRNERCFLHQAATYGETVQSASTESLLSRRDQACPLHSRACCFKFSSQSLQDRRCLDSSAAEGCVLTYKFRACLFQNFGLKKNHEFHFLFNPLTLVSESWRKMTNQQFVLSPNGSLLVYNQSH